MRRNPIGWALLPAGKVNLKTGNSTYFNIFDNVKDSSGTLVLLGKTVYDLNPSTKYRVAMSAGGSEYFEKSHPVGSTAMSFHDQTGRAFEPEKVIGYFPVTREGVDNLITKIGKNSVGFCVFK